MRRAPATWSGRRSGSAPRRGTVSFPTSTKNAAAQAEFERGLAALHSFWYEEAAKAFQRAQQLDPQFAMAYWGEAMTYNEPVWFAQDLDSGRAALKRLPVKAPTAREQAYVHAVEVLYGSGTKEDRDFEYATAMRRLYENHPDDHEAAAFYALALLTAERLGDDQAAAAFRACTRAARA